MRNNKQPLTIAKPHATHFHRRRFVVGIGILICVAGIFFGVWYGIFIASWGAVKEIRVSGTRMVSEAVVTQAVVSYFSTGIRRFMGSDRVAFWIGTGGSIDTAFKTIPGLDRVDIKTDVVNRSVRIVVRERVLQGIWCGTTREPQENTCFAFDETGFLFALAPKPEGTLITRIEDTQTRTIGQYLLAERDWFTQIQHTLAGIAEAKHTITAVVVTDVGLREWEVHLPSGTVFRFSFMAPIAAITPVLNSLAERVQIETLSYIDFRVQNRIYYQ